MRLSPWTPSKPIPLGGRALYWNVSRDGHWGYCGDDWISGSGWHGSRVWIKSEVQTMDVKLCISIHGKRRVSGKLRASRWALSVSVDGVREQVSTMGEVGASCNSVKDATRRAEKHPGIEAAIARVLKSLYSRGRARCLYRWSKVEQLWRPLCTHFYTGRDVWPFMSPGKYCTVQWEVPMRSWKDVRAGKNEPLEPRITRGTVSVHGLGSWVGCMGSTDESIKHLTPWLDNLDRTC